MASLKESSDLARAVANKSLGEGSVVAVWGEATEDSEGNDAIRLVLVMPAERGEEFTGEQLIDAVANIRRSLEEAGETRTPIVQYATQSVLTNG